MQFHRDGIRFQYPESWQLTREDADAGWTVTVESPGTAFFLLTLDESMPEVGLVIQTALDALQADYPDLEADDALESLAGQPAMGHDISFFSLDLTNTCCTRSFYSGAGTVLDMWQASDVDLDQVEPVCQAIRAPLRIEED